MLKRDFVKEFFEFQPRETRLTKMQVRIGMRIINSLTEKDFVELGVAGSGKTFLFNFIEEFCKSLASRGEQG
jgi:hypothetical protein